MRRRTQDDAAMDSRTAGRSARSSTASRGSVEKRAPVGNGPRGGEKRYPGEERPAEGLVQDSWAKELPV